MVLTIGFTFSAIGPPGPVPVASQNIRFNDTGVREFAVTISPYLSNRVTLDVWGGLGYFQDSTGWIEVEFSQNGLVIATENLYASGGDVYRTIYIEPGVYDVEVVAMPSFCSLSIYQEEIDGRNSAQRVWDEMELDYILVILIAIEIVLLAELYARRIFKPR